VDNNPLQSVPKNSTDVEDQLFLWGRTMFPSTPGA